MLPFAPCHTFGLSTKEMLQMNDKQLNQIVSLKKLAPYRTDEVGPC